VEDYKIFHGDLQERSMMMSDHMKPPLIASVAERVLSAAVSTLGSRKFDLKMSERTPPKLKINDAPLRVLAECVSTSFNIFCCMLVAGGATFAACD